jgi:site-specific recombinase XerD
MRTITLEKGLATFLNTLSGKNRSAATIRAYATDIAQFIVATRGRKVDCLARLCDQTCCSISSILRRCAGR